MKIGMLTWSYWPDPEGGAERQCRLLCEYFNKSEHDCTVLTGRSLCAGSSKTVYRFGFLCPLENGLRRILHFGALNYGVQYGKLYQMLSFWFLLPFSCFARLSFIVGVALFASQQRKAPFDVIHVHDSGWLAGLGVWLGLRWQIPVLCKEATTPALKPVSFGTPFRRYWEKMRKQADGWIAQTDNIRLQLIDMGIPKSSVHIIPNGVCVPKETAAVCENETVLYVGNLTQSSEWKAFDVLFEAWLKIIQKRPQSKLVFVGGGNAAPWKHYLADAGISETVRFMGRIADPSCYYAAAGLFLLPSRVEGMSNALLEAQSWGLACVVSDIPANLAVVENNVNGLVVPVGDSKALAAAILRLFAAGDLRKRFGAQARKKMTEQFEIGRVAKRVEEAYRTILKRRGN